MYYTCKNKFITASESSPPRTYTHYEHVFPFSSISLSLSPLYDILLHSLLGECITNEATRSIGCRVPTTTTTASYESYYSVDAHLSSSNRDVCINEEESPRDDRDRARAANQFHARANADSPLSILIHVYIHTMARSSKKPPPTQFAESSGRRRDRV